jgi:hypothetical protein
MKKLLLILFLLNCINFAFSQTIATNFNVADCAGTNHDLFAELDAGKVIVISFVMPCGSCIGPSLSANSKVKSYATSDPGRVNFYIADDYANTNCTSLTSWANTNGMTGVPVFSSTVVKMSDYGTAGMPKVVVIAGKDHSILFNQDNTINTTELTDAINKGLSLTPNGIADNSVPDFKLELFPNPLKTDKIALNYSLNENSDVIVELYNALGSIEQIAIFEKQTPGKHEAILNFEGLSNGVYLVKFNAENSSKTLKIIIAH